MSKTVTQILQEIHDEADHIIGTDAYRPMEVAIENSKRIKKLAKEGLILTDEIYNSIGKAIEDMEW